MGQGVQIAQWEVSIARQARPSPTHFVPNLWKQNNARFLFKLVTPAYVLKNKNLQHESYSSSSHDSNDIKNLI